MDWKKYLSEWRDSYRNDLVNNIMPFWMRNGLDRVNGGVYTCLDRDGSLIDSTKSVWFQGRFAFVCSFAYNNVDKNPEWLAAAKSTIDFIENHCFDTDGRMYFEVTADGKPLRKRRYVFSETFAAIAMAEYSKASGDKSYAEKALKLFNDIRRFISTPGYMEPKYLETLQAKGHSIVMILINTASRIREVIDAPELDAQICESIESLKDFMKDEFKALLETVGPNGEFIDTCNGRIINPGHCIETAWFLLEEAKHRGWEKELTQRALRILDWSWEWGWDKQYGGIINFRDCRNLPPQDYSQDMKFWWPQTEAIIATLYAYEATKDDKYLIMHKQISDWTYAHFPDNEYGEWYGYLHRDGTVAQPAKGNIFRGPFHIPRMMIKSYQLCNLLLEE
ncbi:MAG: AGE family epimerase/isomerase [Bacteroidaceae bacterium]|nr:AGE family epimerase/isomerase [Bacteroidaceae bacterium]